MRALAAVALGAVVGLGMAVAAAGLQRWPERTGTRVRSFRPKSMRPQLKGLSTQHLLAVGLAAALALGAFAATGWPVALLIGAATGLVGPKMYQAPRQRRAAADEVEAYSQWTEQLRDLVAASGSLYEAVALSADSAPLSLRPHVAQMVSLARTVGLRPAMSWFAARMASPNADRLILGMSIAWESGARVTEAFESTAKAMRTEVEMRRRNEVANARTWTQVSSILGITVVSVVGMFAFNPGFFDPFGTTTGQIILLVVGALIFGNVLWVLQLAGQDQSVRLLDASGLPGVSEDAVPSPQEDVSL